VHLRDHATFFSPRLSWCAGEHCASSRGSLEHRLDFTVLLVGYCGQDPKRGAHCRAYGSSKDTHTAVVKTRRPTELKHVSRLTKLARRSLRSSLGFLSEVVKAERRALAAYPGMLALSLARARSLSLSISLSLSLARLLALSLSLACSLSLYLSISLSLFLYLFLSLSLACSLARALSLSHTHTHLQPTHAVGSLVDLWQCACSSPQFLG
jgi:hypothetical protein